MITWHDIPTIFSHPVHPHVHAASPSCVRYFCGHSSMKGAAMPFSAARCSRCSSSMASMSPTWCAASWGPGKTCWGDPQKCKGLIFKNIGDMLENYAWTCLLCLNQQMEIICCKYGLKLRNPQSSYSPFDGFPSAKPGHGLTFIIFVCWFGSFPLWRPVDGCDILLGWLNPHRIMMNHGINHLPTGASDFATIDRMFFTSQKPRHADVLSHRQLVTHEVLKDGTAARLQGLRVPFSEIPSWARQNIKHLSGKAVTWNNKQRYQEK